MAFVTGDRKLDRTLKIIATKVAEKAVASGIRAGLGELRKSIRAQIPQPAVRKAVATRFKRRKKAGTVEAKAGFGVGKQKKLQTVRARPGVGISKTNAHWYGLGTSERRQRTTGRRTGRMPASQAVTLGTSLGYGSAMNKLRAKTAAVIQKEAIKARGR